MPPSYHHPPSLLPPLTPQPLPCTTPPPPTPHTHPANKVRIRWATHHPPPLTLHHSRYLTPPSANKMGSNIQMGCMAPGEPFARKGLVTVSVNYRLGLGGFMHLPSQGSTNMAIRDLIAGKQVRRSTTTHHPTNPPPPPLTPSTPTTPSTHPHHPLHLQRSSGSVRTLASLVAILTT